MGVQGNTMSVWGHTLKYRGIHGIMRGYMGLWAIDGSLGEYMGVEGSSWAYEDILRKAREYMCYQGRKWVNRERRGSRRGQTGVGGDT